MDWKTITPLLEEKLNPADVHPPSKFGPKGDYIEGWHAIAEANRIFGFGGWSYTIDMQKADLREGTNSKGDMQWQAAYVCICTVTVGEVTRQDVGYGSGFAKGIGDAIEGATKEAATDALKRALRTFGNKFGLALYDKSRGNVGAPEAKPITEPQYLRIKELADQKGVDTSKICAALNIASLPEMPADKFDSVLARLNKTPVPA